MKFETYVAVVLFVGFIAGTVMAFTDGGEIGGWILGVYAGSLVEFCRARVEPGCNHEWGIHSIHPGPNRLAIHTIKCRKCGEIKKR